MACFKMEMQRGCFYINVFLKRTEHLEKLRCHFHLVFPVMPVKVAFERITFITAVTGKSLYLPLQRHLLLADNEFACASLWKHYHLSANINKKHASELF